MTIIDEILICANQLANAGKKPSVALVKAKLSQPAPLATLITTLKSWQHQPDFISLTVKEEEQVNPEALKNNTAALLDSLLESGLLKEMIQQTLEQELSGIKKELSDIKLLIANLSEQLENKK